MPTDAISIRFLTDEGLKTYRATALRKYTDPRATRADEARAAKQILAGQDEAARRRGLP